LKEIQQFETVAQNECTKPIWQSHVKNTIMKELGKYQSIEPKIWLTVKNSEQKHNQRQPEVAANGYTNLVKRELNLQLIHTLIIECQTFEGKKSSPDTVRQP
jgi:hypothetical protein